MQLADGPRPVVLSQALLGGALAALIACDGATAPDIDAPAPAPAPAPAAEALPPPGSLPLCDKYRDDENTYGFCVSRYSSSLPTAEAMIAACSTAGRWEADCRHAWVAGRQQSGSGFTTEDLLAACGEAPDCTFELIDFRPDPDPVVQIGLCAAHTGPYGRDCAGHAMQRFWLTDPSPARWAEVAVARVPFQDRIGYWLGVEVACFQKGECTGDGPVRHNCQQTVSDFQRNPARCPSRQKMQMPKPQIQNTAPQPGRPPGRPPGSPPPGQGG